MEKNDKSLDEDFEEIQESDETDWKSETHKLREKAIRQRETTKELRDSLKEAQSKLTEFEKSKLPINEKKESSDYDNGRIANLKASGLKGKDELALFREYRKRFKDDIPDDDVLESSDFIGKLEGLRTTKSNEAASNTGEGSSSPRKNTAAYYISQGVEPPADASFELRKEYVKLREKHEGSSGMFYNDK